MNYQKIHEVERAIKDLDLEVMNSFNVPSNYYGECYNDEIETIKKRMLKLDTDCEAYQESLDEIKKILESYAVSFN